jgi:hypothetical protein
VTKVALDDVEFAWAMETRQAVKQSGRGLMFLPEDELGTMHVGNIGDLRKTLTVCIEMRKATRRS